MILITGSNGQLGKELSLSLKDAILTDVKELDITNEKKVKDFVNEKKIDLIINCAAYTAVDKAEDDEDLANKINALGPKNLAMTGAKIIHISTDYVFDGMHNIPYTPDDKTNPISVYGKTKLDGENAIIKYAKEYVIIRTAWLYSSYGNNFVKTMIKLGKEKEVLDVVSDQIGTPTYAFDLKEAIIQILPKLNKKTSGIYHFTNEGVASWYDFARKIMELSKIKCLVYPISSSQYKTKAKRPFYSILDKAKIKSIFNLKIEHWEDALKRCLEKMSV